MKKLYFIFLNLLLLTGCDTKKTTPVDNLVNAMSQKEQYDKKYKEFLGANATNVLYKTDIYRIMSRNGITNLLDCNISHHCYAKVDKSYIASTFSSELAKFYFDLKIFNWQEIGTFHCEDYAQGASFLARVKNLHDKNRIEGASYAVGVIYYYPSFRIGTLQNTHAINVCIDKNNNLFYYEPQKQKIIELSNTEINSIYYWEF